MDGLKGTIALVMILGTFHHVAYITADAYKVLNIPEKIIGGVIDIVQNHKNKPTQQATFQQSVQTQTSFTSAGNSQVNSPTSQPQQPWTGPTYQGPSLQGQAQFQAQGQFGTSNGNYGTGGSYPAAPTAPVYPVNTVPAAGGAPMTYPVNQGSFQQQPAQQQGFQSQNQGQYQNYQNQGQYQNQNQQANFQSQSQSQGQNQNQNNQFQSAQYGNNQQTGPFVAQSSGGNYQMGQATSGNYHNGGQASGANYLNQNGGLVSGLSFQVPNTQTTGNYQNSQTGQYNNNAQYNPNQPGGQFVQSSAQNHQSGYYPGGGQQTVGQTGQSQASQTGSYGSQSGGFMTSSSHQSGSPGPSCVCQAWTKPPQPQVLSDELPNPNKIEKKTDEIKQTSTA